MATAVTPPPSCVHDLFEEQAARHPERSAVRFQRTTYSYREIDARATCLAGHLQSLGVGGEARVAVSMSRRPELLVAILGVLKAGGAFLPIDPALPAKRVAFMLEDAGCTIVLTSASIASRVSFAARTICLDDEWPAIEAHQASGTLAQPLPNQLAYVIYTSGSTGTPKGVMVSHASAVNYLRWSREAYRMDGGATPAHLTIGADMAITCLLGPLVAGGEVVLFDEADGVEALSAALARPGRYSFVKLTPAHLRVLRQLTPVALLDRAAMWIVGGEALHGDHLEPWRAEMDSTSVVNEYGPTEAAVGCCVHRVPSAFERGSAVPIGSPIANTQLHILDAQLQPVSDDQAGELFIGGIGLARGYLRRPASTAERFVPDPFDSAGGRLFRSGDLVRRRIDGALEFLGRLDDQIKLRGHRIELGEIEEALRGCEGVRDAVVALREDAPGQHGLVGYVVPHQAPVDTDRIAASLRERLPDHMVPAAIATIAALPLTASGKIDRRSLPSPDADRAGDARALTPTEQRLAAVWGRVLERDRIAATDNFFRIGGDSILSLQLVAEAHDEQLTFTIPELFDHPTVERLAALLDSRARASERSASIAAFSLVSADDRRLLPDDVSDAYPLAALQHGMLFHSEFAPDSSMYHDITSVRIRAAIEVEAMRGALEQIVERHEVLRTSFDLHRYSVPLQLVRRRIETPLACDDLTALSTTEREEAVRQWIEIEKARPFEWRRSPLWRFHIHQLGRDELQCTFSFHHAILDGWSTSSLFAELFHRARAIGQGAALDIPAPAARFADFIRSEMEAARSDASRDFWSDQLTGWVPARVCPPRVSDGNPRLRLGREPIPISAARSERLVRVAEIIGVPVKSVLLGCHLDVLARLSGATTVVTGVPSHGRPDVRGGEQIAGLFLNLLPFRVHVEADTWATLARQAHDKERELQRHGRYPLARMKEQLAVESICDTAFNYTHFRSLSDVVGTDGVELLDESFFEETNYTFAANFFRHPATQQLGLYLCYDSGALTRAEIDRAARLYTETLDAIAADPHAGVPPRSTPAWTANPPPAPPLAPLRPSEACVHQLVSAQCRRTPNAIAIECGDERLNYAELDDRSDLVARTLSRHGVGPDVVAAVCLERSIDFVVAVLGVLKAGGAYAPLDPSSPPARLAWLLEDVGAVALLTDEAGLRRFGTTPPIPVLQIEQLMARGDRGSPMRPAATHRDNLAYVVYTSGSTGGPKGVMVTHGAILKLVCGTDYAQLRSDDVVGHASNVSFDAATYEIWGALLNGARIVVLSKETMLSLDELGSTLRHRSITALFLTTALFNQVARRQPDAFAPLRHLLFGGELVDPSAVALVKKVPPARLLHVYGPTECTTFSSWYEVPDSLPADGTVPIGRPIAHAHAYVFDARLAPTAVGQVGELCIGGGGVARGYLRRPRLTAERFVPDPHGEPGARVYRTGDHVRYRPDGHLEFVGRVDDQVKLRGFRVEPAEVEASLRSVTGVSDATVLVRTAADGDRELVAFFMGADAAGQIGEIWGWLRRALPEYMVPAALIPVEAWPLTPNGKVDRSRLLELAERPAVTVSEVPPRDSIESLLVECWKDVLGVDRVGIRDSFFDLGGHSLRATRLVTRIRDVLRISLPLKNLLDAPTIEATAAAIRARQRGAASREPELPPITPRPPGAVVPLSDAQERLWYLDRLEPASAAYNVIAAVQLTGALNVGALDRGLRDLIARHESLRTVFRDGVDGPTQVVLEPPASEPCATIIDLTNHPPGDRHARALQIAAGEARRRIDLAAGPLCRVLLLRLAARDHVLAIVVHHAITDGWSMNILVSELMALYHARAVGSPSGLAPLAIQYADFALWQRRWLTQDTLREDEEYWRRQLAGAPSTTEISGRRRPRQRTGQGALQRFVLSPDLVAGVRVTARSENATMFMALLTAAKIVLAARSGPVVVVGTNTAGRNRAELEGVVGMFVNNLVLCTDLSGDPTIREAIGRVRATCLGAYAHQHVPFERVVAALQPPRLPGTNPLFQVLFVVHDLQPASFDLRGLQAQPIDLHSGAAAFDLLINLHPRGGTIDGRVEYATDLLSEETVGQLVDDYHIALRGMIDQPGAHLSEIALGRQRTEQALIDAFGAPLGA